ncbi:MAG: hypothetical protein JJE39_09400 [Vicinamibacteria bacterium]|nr:hypothetical protein [Vicinamibacteria bacterium]
MEPTPLTGEARSHSWRVFALVLLSAVYFFQSSGHNEGARFDQMRSIVEHDEFEIDRFAWNTADIIRVGDHTYPGKAPGTSLLGALPWGVLRGFFALLPINVEKQLVLVTYALTILMSALPTALTSLLMLRFFSRNGWTIGRATLLALGYGLGTIAFPFATVFFGHQLSAFFAFASFYFIWASRWDTGGSSRSALLLSGLMIGFLPVIEHPGAIASGLIALYAVVTLGWRSSTPVLVGALAGVLPLPLYNQMAFGDPQTMGYSFYARANSPFPGHKMGIMGVSWPRLDILREITFKPQRGLFYANPWLVFALVSPFFVRRIRGLRREFCLAATIFVCFLLFNAGYGDSIIYWGGGFSFGPRHLLIAIPFAVLLAAFPMKSRYLGPLQGVLIVATMFFMLVATAIDPRLPYEPTEPFLGFYLPLYASGLFSTYPWSPFSQSPIFGSSGAFNLGRVAGLPRDLEILPLTLLWALFALTLMKAPRRPRGGTRILVAGLAIAIGLGPALPRLAWAARTPGLCRAISENEMWPYFSDYALMDEPGVKPRLHLVSSPSIQLKDKDGGGSAAKVAITFSSHFEPAVAGWHVFQVTTIGRAALYVDGLRRLKIEDGGEFEETGGAQIYLSKDPHELIVRYMSGQPERELSVSIALRDAPLTPLRAGLTSGPCR